MRLSRRIPRGLLALPCLAALLAMAGCAPYRAAVIPPLGVLYSDVSAPLIVPGSEAEVLDLSSVEIHTSHFQIPYSYLRIINLGWGDAAVQEAIRESGFREVHFADYRFFTILSVYSTFTVRVYGRS